MKILTKKIVLLSLSLNLLICTSCSKKNISLVESKKVIEVIVKERDGDFWGTVKLGAEAAADEFDVNINFTAPSDEKDIDVQINMIQDAIDRKVDAIVLAACDYKKLVGISEEAIAKDIPVIIIDSALDSKKMTSVIATDNKAAGEMAGNKLLQLLNSKGNIGVISFVKGAATAEQRETGLMEAITKYPGIKVVQTEYCFSNIQIAEELTRKMISENTNIDAIVALNAPSTIGAANAVQELKLEGKVTVVGFDCYTEHIDFIEEGVIQATVVQNPYSMGYLGVKYSLDVINKKTISKYVDTGSKVIDKSNMYLPENQKLLFPFVN